MEGGKGLVVCIFCLIDVVEGVVDLTWRPSRIWRSSLSAEVVVPTVSMVYCSFYADVCLVVIVYHSGCLDKRMSLCLERVWCDVVVLVMLRRFGMVWCSEMRDMFSFVFIPD